MVTICASELLSLFGQRISAHRSGRKTDHLCANLDQFSFDRYSTQIKSNVVSIMTCLWNLIPNTDLRINAKKLNCLLSWKILTLKNLSIAQLLDRFYENQPCDEALDSGHPHFVILRDATFLWRLWRVDFSALFQLQQQPRGSSWHFYLHQMLQFFIYQIITSNVELSRLDLCNN